MIAELTILLTEKSVETSTEFFVKHQSELLRVWTDLSSEIREYFEDFNNFVEEVRLEFLCPKSVSVHQ